MNRERLQRRPPAPPNLRYINNLTREADLEPIIEESEEGTSNSNSNNSRSNISIIN